jgi:hypothetical protein
MDKVTRNTFQDQIHSLGGWRYAFILTILLGLCPTLCFGEVRWESEEIEVKAAIDDTKISFDFPFVVRGDRKISIVQVTPSCECTTAEPSKQVYNPGEKGRISGFINLGSHVGQVKKTILVRTDDEKDPVTNLSIIISIPSAIIATPPFVFWERGEEAKPKTIRIKLQHEGMLKLSALAASNDAVHAELKATKEKDEFEMFIYPGETSQAMTARVDIEVTMKDKKKRKNRARYRIREVMDTKSVY